MAEALQRLSATDMSAILVKKKNEEVEAKVLDRLKNNPGDNLD